MIERLRRRHLVLADLHVLGDGNCLIFVEHAEPVALFDSEVLDRVLRFVPALHVGLFVHDQGAEVPRVEHDDVSHLGLNIELGYGTQPGSHGHTLLRGLDGATEIVVETDQLYRSLERVRVHLPENFAQPHSWDEIAGQLQQYESVSAIVIGESILIII